MKRKIAAILAADIVGYSRLVAEDEEDTLSRLDSYRRVYEDFVTRAGGRIFNTAGDSVLAEFSSAVEATRCAIDIQESIRTRNLGYSGSRQMLFRMGLTIGDVVEREGDLLGDGVNIAARLEGLAAPGGICVSQSVFEQVANKISVPFRDIGRQEVKNIPQPIHAFMVEMRGEGVPPRGVTGRVSALDRHRGHDRGSGTAVLIGILALLLGGGALAFAYWWPSMPNIGKKPIVTASQPAKSNTDSDSQLAGKETTVAAAKPSAGKEPQTPTKPQVLTKPQVSKKQEVSKKPEIDKKPQVSSKPESSKNSQISKELVTDKKSSPDKQTAVAAKPKQSLTGKPAGTAQTATPAVRPGSALPPAAQAQRPKFPAGASPAAIYAVLSKAGGIVQNAVSAPALYHNARVWEARGQAAAARRSYDKLARLGTKAIDPHMRYAALIRAQDGRAGAREVYGELASATGNPAAALVHAMQFSGAERQKRVASVAASHHAYAPAHMALAREYSVDRLGSQTLEDKRQQFDALKAFLKVRDDGVLPKYFMDHSILAAWTGDARKTHARLETYFRTAVLKPVASYMRSNQGWMVNLSLPEAAKQISYRVGSAGSFKPTGTFPHLDQRTGQPMANPSFQMPADAGATALHIRYRDARNSERGPFVLQFDPRSALIAGQKNILERFPNNWLVFGKNERRDLLYFTHLVSYRCAIAKAEIAIDDAPFEKKLPIPACDMRDPHAIPRKSKVFLKVPQSARSVRVRITFADGAKSEEQAFRRQ